MADWPAIVRKFWREYADSKASLQQQKSAPALCQDLAARRRADLTSLLMVETVISIRTARVGDEADIASVHDAAWREAYRGVIPGRELEQMIARRGSAWWRVAIARRTPLLVLEFSDTVVGYVSYGRNRVPALGYGGEIFELYLSPECQGCGFGRRMFDASRKDLASHGYATFVVWALADNERAVGFYQRLGGRIVRRAHETFGGQERERIAFGFS
jgi:ribosomal protein S18 acetylase RimI-like enzyme